MTAFIASAAEMAAIRGTSRFLGLTSVALVETCEIAALNRVVGDLPANSLRFALHSGEAAPVGLLCIDADLSNAIVEIRTAGDVSGASGQNERPLTAADARICQSAIDNYLQALLECWHEISQTVSLGKLALRHFRPEPSEFEYVLPKAPFVCLKISVDLGVHGRNGRIHLALPATMFDEPGRAVNGSPAADRKDASCHARQQMLAIAGSATAIVECVLTRFSLPLVEIAGLKPGDSLELPHAATTSVRLEFTDGDGNHVLVSQGDLGSAGNRKAFRYGGGSNRFDPTAEKSGGHGDNSSDLVGVQQGQLSR